mmetsp:Transcript_12846/g.24117  ORF Transcript_12846/g.24117 Transcript_12846/m.24117 type:complete len:815 (+) Transcript_12846:198-2642(+)|eukprot:CAMPEP_0176483082 /NCGR_PEP_ID=MMETSP0200_2-20121128/3732_1 /TAXON_ID=947934 /ORGANISM="Chaetoceros sp., Strain GSL56" /LENGTH=814 /DNA_ID=CAMNT_0017879467 /DNA_START=191 /DNA_END=2635 /DNA_ORIENTATION=-
MELPFAVDNNETEFLHGNAIDKNRSRYDNVTSNSITSNFSTKSSSRSLEQQEREQQQQQMSRGITTSSPQKTGSMVSSKSSSTSYQPINQYGNLKSTPIAQSHGELLRGAALYDNVRPHFYNVRSSKSSSTGKVIAAQPLNSLKERDSGSSFEDDFVTINADDDTFTVQTSPSVDTPTVYNSYHFSSKFTSDESIKAPFLSATSSKSYSNIHGHPVDILALLLNTVAVASSTSSLMENVEDVRSGTENFMSLCQKASNESKLAAGAVKEGNIVKAIQCHVKSSKFYTDAAILLKRDSHSTNCRNSHRCSVVGHEDGMNHGKITWSGDLKYLAYSLLLLSNAQARSADCLMNSAGGCKSIQQHEKEQTRNRNATPSLTDDATYRIVGEIDRNDGSRDKKEDRLRAKIRASMNTAEADMTDSVFLGKATKHNHQSRQLQEQKETQKAPETRLDSSPISVQQQPTTDVNPVDDMMELEKELRDMDAALNMGVDLSASTSSIMTKKTLEDGSFCVVPGSNASVGGSSYMSSSMMWASGIGGRQHVQQQNTQPHQGRARANRVQSILGASSMGMPRTLSMVANQHTAQSQQLVIPTSSGGTTSNKHHPAGLESSWWGQASALASSTTSLSNSMVGIRSANMGANHPGSNAAGLPTNTKQLMRLLDSLKTLGDENASLLREVEDAKKARMEAKAARETMRQFKEEYNKRFAALKNALDKFRTDYPEQKSAESSAANIGVSANNIVIKSNFVKNNTLLEMQKRDKMIQKLTADLRAERVESKKKDDALRKYENFYKEVKARSEQKKKQKEDELKRKNHLNG